MDFRSLLKTCRDKLHRNDILYCINPPSPRGNILETPPSLEGGVPKGRGMLIPNSALFIILYGKKVNIE